MYLKMALLFIFVNISFLNANNFVQFKTISWDWIAIIILVVLFLLLLLSIIKDIRNTRRRVNEILIEEKCKKYDQNCYLSDINNQNIKVSKKLDDSINILKETTNDDKIIDNLTKFQKEIFANTQEENIFLNIATNKELGKNSIFNISDSLKELKEYDLLKRTTINFKNKISYRLIGNEKILQAIIFLLTRLQLKEGNIKNPKIDIYLDDKKSILQVSIPKELELNQDIVNAINNNLEPKYNNKDKKYYGVYLYLLNKLTDRVNGNLSIETINNNSYKVDINMPIDLDKKIQDINIDINKKLKTKKSALIISNSIETSRTIEAYLLKYNFNTTVELNSELNKEIPNFLNFDIVLMDAELYEPILSDYIISVKKYSDLKVVSLEKKDKLYSYPDSLIDSKIDINTLDSDLNSIILKHYNSELIEKDIKIENDDIQEENNYTPAKKSKVLIADDDRTNLHILEHLIKQYGVEVHTAKNGIEALEVLDNHTCDLIILDSIMPKLDGFETIKKIRVNEQYNSTPVVIHTSFSLKKNSIESIFKLGFDSYLPKPFNKSEIKALLERYIPISDSKPKEIKEDKLDSRDDLEEFLAIYSNSDKLIERYIKENRKEQAISILKDLKHVSNKIGAFKFVKTLSKVEETLYNTNTVDSNLIYTLSTNLQQLKSNIAKRLKK